MTPLTHPWLSDRELTPDTVRAVVEALRPESANDLAPDHILLDPESGRVTGILDWTDAAWGDPALDFVVLRTAMGAAFCDAMAGAYTLPVDPGFRERIDFMAKVESLDWLHDAHLQGADVVKHRRWVEQAFTD